MSRLQTMFTHRPGLHRPRPLRDGAILLGIMGLLLYAGFTKTIPFVGKGGTLVQMDVADLTHLQKGSQVRVAGVDVGKIDAVRLGDGGRGARVTLRIDDDSGVQVHKDARAGIFWRTLLGRNMYVELDPGSSSAPLLGDEVIPLSRTTAQQELDQVLAVADVDQRAALRKTITAFDEGAKDPDAIGSSIDALGPAARNLRLGLPALRGTQAGDLGRLVREASKTMGSLGASEERLAGLIDNGRMALGVTAARSDALGSTIDQAPGTMADTRATLARVRSTLDDLDPVTKDILPGASRLKDASVAARPALDRLDVVLDDAEPTIRSLRPAVTRLATAVDPGKTVINELRPIVDRANDSLLPFLDRTDSDSKLKNFAAIGPTFSALSSGTSSFDANGRIINFQTFPDERSLQALPCTLRFTDPSAAPDEKLNCDALGELLNALGGTPTSKSTAKGKATR